MAFSIGGEYNLNNINFDSLVHQAKQTNINPSIVKRWFNDVYLNFTTALNKSAEELGPVTKNIADKIINLGGFKNF